MHDHTFCVMCLPLWNNQIYKYFPSPVIGTSYLKIILYKYVPANPSGRTVRHVRCNHDLWNRSFEIPLKVRIIDSYILICVVKVAAPLFVQFQCCTKLQYGSRPCTNFRKFFCKNGTEYSDRYVVFWMQSLYRG